MRPVGFSTGALAKGDFRAALEMLAPFMLPCLELSALRMDEVMPLVEALPSLDLSRYETISFHAPSRFGAEDEAGLAQLLSERIPKQWPIVMHPDAIFNPVHWRRFGNQLAVENMDRRKPCGRSVAELERVFGDLPDASLCFDIGHARQYDSSMTEAYLILSKYGKRLVQVHVSEVNSESQHDAISYGATLVFQQVAGLIPQDIPLIVESRVGKHAIGSEIKAVRNALLSEVEVAVHREVVFA